jgi:hypothetical protein
VAGRLERVGHHRLTPHPHRSTRSPVGCSCPFRRLRWRLGGHFRWAGNAGCDQSNRLRSGDGRTRWRCVCPGSHPGVAERSQSAVHVLLFLSGQGGEHAIGRCVRRSTLPIREAPHCQRQAHGNGPRTPHRPSPSQLMPPAFQRSATADDPGRRSARYCRSHSSVQRRLTVPAVAEHGEEARIPVLGDGPRSRPRPSRQAPNVHALPRASEVEAGSPADLVELCRCARSQQDRGGWWPRLWRRSSGVTAVTGRLRQSGALVGGTDRTRRVVGGDGVVAVGAVWVVPPKWWKCDQSRIASLSMRDGRVRGCPVEWELIRSSA